MNDDLTLLASAYLDGDVTADERARVVSDPALLAEVERLRSVTLLLNDLDSAPISVRESHLAAAFDVWDRLPQASHDSTPGGIDTSTRSRSLGDRRRRVWSSRVSARWMAGAAAGLTLVVAAGVALQFVQLSGDDSSSTDANSDAAASAFDSPADGASDEASSDADELDPPAERAVAESDSTIQLDTAVGAPPPPPEEAGLQQLSTPEDLAAFASFALGAPVAPDGPAATSAPLGDVEPDGSIVEIPLCLGADVIVGPAMYGDVLVIVAVDEGRELALAYRGENCREVARASLGEP